MDTVLLWERFKGRLIHDAESGFSLDTSRLSYDDAYLSRMEPLMQSALKAMSALEQGAIANPDEGLPSLRRRARFATRSPPPSLGLSGLPRMFTPALSPLDQVSPFRTFWLSELEGRPLGLSSLIKRSIPSSIP